MIHGFSMVWHSQVSSGSARAPEASSGSGGLIPAGCIRVANDRAATIVFLHLLLEGSNNQIYSF
jgi:hypothetical protein